jgi:acetylornithine deacetylase/succinyl-diaminopimelate desuccinylase-like protein
MRAVGAGNLDPGAIRRLSADVETNIALRTTCTATLVDGGHAINALPQRAAATIQCRVIPGESPASVAATLAARVADPSISITPANTVQPSPESPPDAALVREVERVTTELWPGVIVLPEMSAGATDSRYTRPRGLPSYGIDGLFDDLDDGRAHGRDERIGVAAFGDEVEFTFRLMRRLAAAPRP